MTSTRYVVDRFIRDSALKCDVGFQRGSGFWVKIGIELGFIQPQDMESIVSEAADRLATIYKRYLVEFDAIYVMSFVQELQHRIARARLIGCI